MSDLAPKNNDVRNDEIDLLDLLRRIGKSIKNGISVLTRAFLISIVFLIRRWLPLGLSIVAGIAISYFMKSTSKSFYTSDLVIRNNLAQLDKKKHRDNSGTTSDIISKINKLQTYCTENNSEAISYAISLSPDLVKNINDISAFWIIDLGNDGVPDFVDYKGIHNIYDTANIRMPDRIDIRVSISSSLDLNRVRDGIIKFIENDSLNQQKNRLRISQNHELVKRLNFDIQQLDSLQKVKYFEETRNLKPGKDGQIVFMQEQKTQLVYTDIYSLYARKQLLETDQNLYKGVVTLLSDFSVPTLRNNGARYYGKQIIPICFLATLLVLIILANRKKLYEIYQKY